MLSLSLVFLIAVISICYYKIQKKYRLSNLPPGPGYFPLLGHLPLLGTHPHLALLRWKRKYGSIFCIRFGSFPTVILNDASTIKAALALQTLSGRPHIEYFDRSSKNRAGMSLADDAQAQLTRQFLRKTLKKYAFAKETTETGVLDLIPSMLDEIRSYARSGEPLRINHFFTFSILSYIWGMVFGSSPSDDEDKIHKLIKLLAELSRFPITVLMGMFIPSLPRRLPLIFGLEGKLREHEAGINNFMQELVEKHGPSLVPGQPRDLVDSLLDFYKGNNKWHVQMSVTEVIGGATETTGTVLEWCIFYLVKHPQVQEKLYKDIKEHVGSDSMPSLHHRSSTSYTEAFLLEVLRKTTVVPLAVFHSAMEDTEFQGYLIPKGTLVIPNLYGAHHDPEVWGDPQNFRPERFLDEKGRLVLNENLIAFGTGKRKCLGEEFARNQLFLSIVSIVQKFQFRASSERELSEKGVFGITLAPSSLEVLVSSREC